MGGAHLERRVARIGLNSNFELRYSCFVYLFVYFGFVFCFFVVVVRAGTYYFLRLCPPAPYLQEKIVVFPEVFVMEGSEARFAFSVCLIRNIMTTNRDTL